MNKGPVAVSIEANSHHAQKGLLSLFCGPGGLDEGFRQAGFTTLLAYDSEEHCVKTHMRNHPAARAMQADLSLLEPGEIITEWNSRSVAPPVGLIGGPPCQAFSYANVWQREDDKRARLVEHYAEIITFLKRELGIRFFVFENVTGLLSPKHKKWYDRFIQQVEDAGFTVKSARLNAVRFGVPQYRERLFIVGINRNTNPGTSFSFPQGDPTLLRDVRSAIGGLPEPAFFSRKAQPQTFPKHPNHWCMRPRSSRFTNGSIIPGDCTASRSLRALAWDRPSFTVAYGNREVHVHPNCSRRLSVFEAMVLQGFMETYELLGNLSEQFSMISDAVAPPVAYAIATSLTEQLDL